MADQQKKRARAVQKATGWAYSAAKSFCVQHSREAVTLLKLRGEQVSRQSIVDELVQLALTTKQAKESA